MIVQEVIRNRVPIQRKEESHDFRSETLTQQCNEATDAIFVEDIPPQATIIL